MKYFTTKGRTLVGLVLLTRLALAADLAQQAAAAWAAREQPGKVEEAIRLWKEAARAEPKQVDHQINLAKATGRAVRRSKSKLESKKWADEARAAAEKAVQLGPSNPEALAVYGEAMGQWANARKGVRSLKTVKLAVASLNKAVEVKPDYAYAHMLLAEFYRQAPSVVSVGDKDKALEHARLAAQHGPAYAINHLVLARALLEHDKKDEAIAELKTVLALPPPADAVPETRADQETAKSMLDMLVSQSTNTSCDSSISACTATP